jgi:hypothetical protein
MTGTSTPQTSLSIFGGDKKKKDRASSQGWFGKRWKDALLGEEEQADGQRLGQAEDQTGERGGRARPREGEATEQNDPEQDAVAWGKKRERELRQREREEAESGGWDGGWDGYALGEEDDWDLDEETWLEVRPPRPSGALDISFSS